jgi:3D (Asp-Asp-Asp) domain-containing protein
MMHRDAAVVMLVVLVVLAVVTVAAAVDREVAVTTIVGEPDSQPLVVRWSQRVVYDEWQPEWKRGMAAAVLRCALASVPQTRLTFRATFYCHDDNIDPTGGGMTTASGLTVRYGLVATDNRYWPLGTVFYCEELDRSLIVADNGPGVRVRRALDVYVPDAATRDQVRAAWGGTSGCGRLHLHVLGRIPIAALR